MASEPGFMFSRSIENPDGYVWEIVWTRSRSGVKLKRPLIERLAVNGRRMNQRQLRRAQRLIGSPARLASAGRASPDERERTVDFTVLAFASAAPSSVWFSPDNSWSAQARSHRQPRARLLPPCTDTHGRATAAPRWPPADKLLGPHH